MPRLQILEPDGQLVPVDVRLSDGYHTPTTPPVRFLGPGREANVFIAWSDYCRRRLRAPLTYRMTFPVGPRVTAKTDAATGNCITGGQSAGDVQLTVLSEMIK
jgi:hypothetical protein